MISIGRWLNFRQIFARAIDQSFNSNQFSQRLQLATQIYDEERFTGSGKSYTKHKYATETDAKKLLLDNDPNTFGTLSAAKSFVEEIEDEGDIDEEKFLQSPPSNSQKLRTKQYADMIKDHLKNKRVHEAIQVLEQRMIKIDRVQPENYIYNLVIGGCARAGFSKKAFQLYNKMKQRNLKVTGGTYTSLFNACANSPWASDGLERASRLREIMVEKGYVPNASNYNAIIKAYGRCGDIKTAFELVDEMKMKNLAVGIDTFNFLLQACITDKELGFRHALIIWHKIYERRLIPDIYSFNLLLRCTRDCEIGDLDATEQVIARILTTTKENQIASSRGKNTKTQLKKLDIEEKQVEVIGGEAESHETPNLLSPTPRLGGLIALREIQKPEDRLLLIGGMSGFLEEMEKLKITPDIKTFTELLEVIPPTLSAEKKLISTIRKLGVRADIDFFNILIKKRSIRFEYIAAKEVLSMIRTAKLKPDIVTYGVLALGCENIEQAVELIAEMRENNIRMNMYILGAMLKQGCVKRNFRYVEDIIKLSMEENIKPNAQFLTHLDKFNTACRYMIKQRHPEVNRTFKLNYTDFRNTYDKLADSIDAKGLKLEDAIAKLKEKPYDQFKEPQSDGFEQLKGEKFRKRTKQHRRLNHDKFKYGDDENDSVIIKDNIGQQKKSDRYILNIE